MVAEYRDGCEKNLVNVVVLRRGFGDLDCLFLEGLVSDCCDCGTAFKILVSPDLKFSFLRALEESSKIVGKNLRFEFDNFVPMRHMFVLAFDTLVIYKQSSFKTRVRVD
ncbi:MAG: hypothetical protein ACYSTS_19435 [Planctomycetota bacterium]|jgi:hypothetical protein